MEIPKERKCTKCGDTKPLDDKNFYPQKGYKYGLTRWCRDCRNKYSTELNKEKRNEYRAHWAQEDRSSHIDKYRVREFVREMKKYGTTTEWYRDKLIEQCGVCALCKHLSHHHGTLQRLQVDHNHNCCDIKTKSCGRCLRGLLCADCNILLSYLEVVLTMGTIIPKKSTWLDVALQYLKHYQVSPS
jgi:hypothetical protein